MFYYIINPHTLMLWFFRHFFLAAKAVYIQYSSLWVIVYFSLLYMLIFYIFLNSCCWLQKPSTFSTAFWATVYFSSSAFYTYWYSNLFKQFSLAIRALYSLYSLLWACLNNINRNSYHTLTWLLLIANILCLYSLVQEFFKSSYSLKMKNLSFYK